MGSIGSGSWLSEWTSMVHLQGGCHGQVKETVSHKQWQLSRYTCGMAWASGSTQIKVTAQLHFQGPCKFAQAKGIQLPAHLSLYMEHTAHACSHLVSLQVHNSRGSSIRYLQFLSALLGCIYIYVCDVICALPRCLWVQAGTHAERRSMAAGALR